MAAKFSKGDAVVIKGYEGPVMTITKIMESNEEQTLSTPSYECNCLECGIVNYKEDEIELFNAD